MAKMAAILTVSDRTFAGKTTDLSGPALAQLLQDNGYSIVQKSLVPDDLKAIQNTLRDWSNKRIPLLITTGGTGFGLRDVTPEAVKPLLQKEAFGLMMLMYQTGLNHTPLAALSRGVIGVCGSSLIVTLPGSVKGSIENLSALLNVLPHALELIQGDSGESFHQTLQPFEPSRSIEVDPTRKGHSQGHVCTHKSDLESHSGIPGKMGVVGRARVSPFPLVSFDDALEMIRTHSVPCESTMISIIDPLFPGSCLAQDVYSPVDLPEFRASVVDGYAVISSDGVGTFPVIDSSIASTSNSNVSMKPGQIVRITTGAPVPEGADAVVMVEDTELIESEQDVEKRVQINVASKQGQWIRKIGSDVAKGDLLLAKGSLISLGGFEVALLASVGLSHVSVIRKPLVAVLSTGNEVLPFDQHGSLPFGGIRDANKPALLSALRSLGYPTLDLGSCSDDRKSLKEAIQRGLEADMIITTGGVSMGELDLLKPVLKEDFDATIHFGRVALKPGKPTTFMSLPNQNKIVFALAGNPVSALVTFQLFCIPSLRMLSGTVFDSISSMHTRIPASLMSDILLDSRPEFRRVYLKRNGTSFQAFQLDDKQQSSRLLSCRGSNGLACLAPSSPLKSMVKSGESVDVILIDLSFSLES